MDHDSRNHLDHHLGEPGSADSGDATLDHVPRWYERLSAQGRLYVFVGAAVTIAVVLSGIGLVMYSLGGTAQLDLSRPGYEGLTQEYRSDTPSFSDFSASGSIDGQALNEFDEKFKKQLEQAKELDAFGGDPLSLDGLGISETSVGEGIE